MKLPRGATTAIFGAVLAAFVSVVGIALAASGTKHSPQIASALATSTGKTDPGSMRPAGGPDAFAQTVTIAQAADRPVLAKEVFKNVPVLGELTVDDFMHTMGIMAASLSMCCNECHPNAGTQFVKWEEDTPRKRRARQMVEMMTTINKTSFGGRQVVTCWTCHRGRDFPSVTPSIDMMYGEPVLEPDEIVTRQFPGQPTPDAILDKYLKAIGGTERLNAITSIHATGVSEGFGGFGGGGAVKFFAKAPDQRGLFITFPTDPDRGNNTRTYNGKEGWLAVPLTVVPEYALGGTELDGARFDAQLSFPGQIKQVLTRLRSGAPDIIADRPVQLVQGLGPRGLLVSLYFDEETGLLSRVIRYSQTAIGRAPTQVDYADYRDVNGVKFPHKWVFGWLDGRDTIEFKQVRLNVPIPADIFTKPTRAAAVAAAAK